MSVTVRALNGNNDIFLADGRVAINVDADAVAQMVKSRLQFYRGEWFLDITAGLPWLQDVFRKPILIGTIESVIKTEIINTEGFSSLTSFTIDFDRTNRQLGISFSGTTEYGDVSKTISINQ